MQFISTRGEIMSIFKDIVKWTKGEDDEDDFEEEYDIVGSTEFDPLNGKISEDSPVGAALKGHKAGETVSVDLPNGASMKLTIKSVEVRR